MLFAHFNVPLSTQKLIAMVALKLIGITVVLLGLGVAGIAIKIWAKKDGEFAGTCASQSPFLNKDGETCSYCGKNPNQCESNPA